jgi:predicted Zn-dependent peptidase
MKKMCSADTFGIPRLGTKEDVQAIEPVLAYEHYRRVLRESPVEIFYVGSAPFRVIANKAQEIFSFLDRSLITLPEHTAFCDGGGGDYVETMDISQGKLCMGFTTTVTKAQDEFAAMQVFNALFGSGMTSKLFNQVREKMSLCYSIGSAYYGGKGILTVSAGIDTDKCDLVKQEILHQFQLCCEGVITEAELTAAKESILSALRGVYDSPSAIESYEFVMAVGDAPLTTEEYRERVQLVDLPQVVAVAKTLKLHTTYFLKGVDA